MLYLAKKIISLFQELVNVQQQKIDFGTKKWRNRYHKNKKNIKNKKQRNTENVFLLVFLKYKLYNFNKTLLHQPEFPEKPYLPPP